MFPWMKMFINIIPMDPPHCTPLHLTLGASEIVVKVVENGKIGRTAVTFIAKHNFCARFVVSEGLILSDPGKGRTGVLQTTPILFGL